MHYKKKPLMLFSLHILFLPRKTKVCLGAFRVFRGGKMRV